MTADNTIADVGNEARHDWIAERPDRDQPSKAELADVAPLEPLPRPDPWGELTPAPRAWPPVPTDPPF